jgi:hypothetical protein
LRVEGKVIVGWGSLGEHEIILGQKKLRLDKYFERNIAGLRDNLSSKD